VAKAAAKGSPCGLQHFNYSGAGAEIDGALQAPGAGADMLDLLLIHFPATGHTAAAANAGAWHATLRAVGGH